jgi:ketosteroid isomerase-like protein
MGRSSRRSQIENLTRQLAREFARATPRGAAVSRGAQVPGHSVSDFQTALRMAVHARDGSL